MCWWWGGLQQGRWHHYWVQGGQKGWYVAAASFACTALFQDHFTNAILLAELFQCIAWLWKIAPVPICLSVLSGSPDAKSLVALIASLAMLKSLGAQLSWCWNVPGPFHCNDGCTDMWWGFELSRLARASHHQCSPLVITICCSPLIVVILFIQTCTGAVPYRLKSIISQEDCGLSPICLITAFVDTLR